MIGGLEYPSINRTYHRIALNALLGYHSRLHIDAEGDGHDMARVYRDRKWKCVKAYSRERMRVKPQKEGSEGLEAGLA